MAASVHILLSEYLHTSYRPDREFVDGELVERNVGNTNMPGCSFFWPRGSENKSANGTLSV